MFQLIKPGHVLRFAVCPSNIHSPPAQQPQSNANVVVWPNNLNNLGLVQCVSHPRGDIAAIAADVATSLRERGCCNVSRSLSYPWLGRKIKAQNRIVGQLNSSFVGYLDGQSNYVASAQTVFSKDFSGCLMVVYTVNGQRRVAHVAASGRPDLDCKEAFFDTIEGQDAVLIGWFKPFSLQESDRKIDAIRRVGRHINNDPNRLTTFGIITVGGQAYSIDAFKPNGINGNDWVVTHVQGHVMDNRRYERP